MKRYYLLALVFSLISCDFVDDRLLIKNDTSDTFMVKLKYFENRDDLNGFYVVKQVNSKDKQALSLLNRRWEYIMKNSSDSSFVRITLINQKSIDSLNLLYLNQNISLNQYDLLDSLISLNNCFSRDFYFRELDQIEWEILYPKESFSKCSTVSSANLE